MKDLIVFIPFIILFVVLWKTYLKEQIEYEKRMNRKHEKLIDLKINYYEEKKGE